jgi:hypothetical protein
MAAEADKGLTSPLGPQPGINGIRYAARTNAVYYTSTGQKVFMRVAVDPATHTGWPARSRRRRHHRRRFLPR